MSKVLVLYYSSYGHIEQLAQAVAEGAREAGATVDIKRVPETAPLEVAKAAHFKLEQEAPIAKIEDLADYEKRRRWRSPRPRISNSSRRHRSPRSRISRTMTRSFSVSRPGSAGCPRKWPLSSIRPVAFG